MPRIGFKENPRGGIANYSHKEVKDVAELKSQLRARSINRISLIYTTSSQDISYHRADILVEDLQQEEFAWLTQDHPYQTRYIEL